MENDVNITYQVMGRQQITQRLYMTIHQEEYIQVYLIISLNKCESNKI